MNTVTSHTASSSLRPTNQLQGEVSQKFFERVRAQAEAAGLRFAGDEASAEKPFVALLDVVGVGVRDGGVRELLLRPLAQGDGSCQPANQNEYDECKETNETATMTNWHGWALTLLSMERVRG